MSNAGTPCRGLLPLLRALGKRKPLEGYVRLLTTIQPLQNLQTPIGISLLHTGAMSNLLSSFTLQVIKYKTHYRNFLYDYPFRNADVLTGAPPRPLSAQRVSHAASSRARQTAEQRSSPLRIQAANELRRRKAAVDPTLNL